jgi:hypothetical protein
MKPGTFTFKQSAKIVSDRSLPGVPVVDSWACESTELRDWAISINKLVTDLEWYYRQIELKAKS